MLSHFVHCHCVLAVYILFMLILMEMRHCIRMLLQLRLMVGVEFHFYACWIFFLTYFMDTVILYSVSIIIVIVT